MNWPQVAAVSGLVAVISAALAAGIAISVLMVNSYQAARRRYRLKRKMER